MRTGEVQSEERERDQGVGGGRGDEGSDWGHAGRAEQGSNIAGRGFYEFLREST